jgi:hypothetical protein
MIASVVFLAVSPPSSSGSAHTSVYTDAAGTHSVPEPGPLVLLDPVFLGVAALEVLSDRADRRGWSWALAIWKIG